MGKPEVSPIKECKREDPPLSSIQSSFNCSLNQYIVNRGSIQQSPERVAFRETSNRRETFMYNATRSMQESPTKVQVDEIEVQEEYEEGEKSLRATLDQYLD